MRCFLGLTFSEDYLSFKKIDEYRRQYDEKYHKSNTLQLTLLSPFEIDQLTQDFLETLHDEIESHLLGLQDINDVHFNGCNYTDHKKGHVYLRPELSLEFQYCQQSLWEVVQDFGGVFKNKRAPFISEDQVRRAHLLIARTINEVQFENAIKAASLQFDNPFSLKSNSISLFESTTGQWPLREKLFDFRKKSFEFNEIDCFEGQVQAQYAY